MVVGNGTVCSSLHFSSVQPALLGKQPPMPSRLLHVAAKRAVFKMAKKPFGQPSSTVAPPL